jgi:hypothetical protein
MAGVDLEAGGQEMNEPRELTPEEVDGIAFIEREFPRPTVYYPDSPQEMSVLDLIATLRTARAERDTLRNTLDTQFRANVNAVSDSLAYETDLHHVEGERDAYKAVAMAASDLHDAIADQSVNAQKQALAKLTRALIGLDAREVNP